MALDVDRNAWRALFAAQLGWMLDAMDFLLFSFAVIPIREEFGLSNGTMGALTSVALLNRAYPNPFSGSMNYAYRVTNANTRVDVGVFNVAGRLVKTLTSGLQSEGTYTLTWNGSDDAGVRMATGLVPGVRRKLPPFGRKPLTFLVT